MVLPTVVTILRKETAKSAPSDRLSQSVIIIPSGKLRRKISFLYRFLYRAQQWMPQPEILTQLL